MPSLRVAHAGKKKLVLDTRWRIAYSEYMASSKVLSTVQFSWNAKTRQFTAVSSDIKWTPRTARDILSIQSHKSGKVAEFDSADFCPISEGEEGWMFYDEQMQVTVFVKSVTCGNCSEYVARHFHEDSKPLCDACDEYWQEAHEQ